MRSLIHGIKNLIKWFPIIWNDYDYDYHCLLKILHHKLNTMEQFFNSDEVYTKNAKKTAQQIMIAKNLTKRLVDDIYLTNATFWHDKKYLRKDWPWKLDNGKVIWVWKEDEQQSFHKCGKHSDYMKQQDLEYLMLMLKKHLRSWWD